MHVSLHAGLPRFYVPFKGYDVVIHLCKRCNKVHISLSKILLMNYSIDCGVYEGT